MTSYKHDLKIPKERIGVLVGKKGEVKKCIESATKTRIEVDSEEGDVIIFGDEPVVLYTTCEIVKAIGRGFNPELAQLLLKQDYALEIINLADYVKARNHFARLKGRVIGENGKTRKFIEDMTDSNVSVYGKTISIIGGVDKIHLARRAIESLLLGSSHANVYKWLEKQRKKISEIGFELKND